MESCAKSPLGARGGRTRVLIIELQEITLLVELVLVAVQEGENGQELGNGIFVEVHEGRLEGLHHGLGSRTISLSPARA